MTKEMTKEIDMKDLGLKGNESLKENSESKSIWADRLEKTLKNEDAFRLKGEEIIKTYENESEQGVPFNILYSNTATLTSALYSNLPRVTVKRRYNDNDPAGMAAAEIIRKSLTYLLDDNNAENTPMDSLFSETVLQALVPGRGSLRFKYEAEISGEGSEGKVENEYICAELVPWDRLILAPSTSWKSMPWAAILHYMTEEEFKKNFPDYNDKISFDATSLDLPVEKEHTHRTQEVESPNDLIRVFEVFDKIEKRVYFISPSNNKGESLKTVNDPWQLSGFYPFTEPLRFVPTISSSVPKALYSMYEVQARELNVITARISAIVEALKVRGFYDGSLAELDKLLSSPDNTLIAVSNTQQLVDRTLNDSIWMMPLGELVEVLQQLYRQREEIKQVIYEITGMGDIMRGVSEASETATAQSLKSKWGTLRLRDMQKKTSLFIRNSLRIAAEMIVNSFSKETLQNMTGVRLPDQMKKELLKMQLMQMQMQEQGQEIPPDMQMMLQIPTWEEVMELLKSDTMRGYRLDLETNSTIDNEIAEDKADIGEFLNAIAQFMNSIAPLIADGTMPFEAAKNMLLAITKRFSFGEEVEQSLRTIQSPQSGPSKEEIEMEMQKLQQEREAFEQEKAKMQTMISSQQTQLDLDKKRQVAEIDLQRQEALKEIELSKRLALKEINQESAASKNETDLHATITEGKLKVKQKLATDQLNAEKSRVIELVRLLEEKLDGKIKETKASKSSENSSLEEAYEGTDNIEDTYYGGA